VSEPDSDFAKQLKTRCDKQIWKLARQNDVSESGILCREGMIDQRVVDLPEVPDSIHTYYKLLTQRHLITRDSLRYSPTNKTKKKERKGGRIK